MLRARYIEPTLRGVRMALGGRDRTFKGLEEKTLTKPARPLQSKDQARVRLCLVKIGFKFPMHTGLGQSGHPHRKQDHGRAQYSACVHYRPSVLLPLVGESLHRNGVKWVADFRDPLAYTRQLSSEVARVHHQQRRIVGKTLAGADAITLASSSMASIYRDMFGGNGVDPVFIPTGIDEGVLQPDAATTKQRQPYLLFAGEVLPEFDAAFWEAFAAAKKHPNGNTGIKVLVVGTLALNRPRLSPFLDRFGLHGEVEFLDQMPQSEIYKLLRKAVAGLLIPGINSRWWTNAAKMTDYIGMRKPVVAIVPDPSEARTALTRSRLGIFLDGCVERRVQILSDFLLKKHPLPAPDEDECDRYTARHQVQSFVEIFESLAKPKALRASTQ